MIYALIFIAYAVIITTLGWFFKRRGIYKQLSAIHAIREKHLNDICESMEKSIADNLISADAQKDGLHFFDSDGEFKLKRTDGSVEIIDHRRVTFDGKHYWVKNECSDLSEISKPYNFKQQYLCQPWKTERNTFRKTFDMDGSEHIVGGDCCRPFQKACECGGMMHYQAVYNGRYWECEDCHKLSY